MSANKLPNISADDIEAFMGFARAHPAIVPADHVLQKLIIFNFVQPFVERYVHNEILEIGCGLGFHSALLSRYGHVTSTELVVPGSFTGAGGNIEKGRQTVFREMARGAIAFAHNDGHKLPFPQEGFDIIYHNSVIEHCPSVHDFNMEVRRVLKPGGIVICITGTPALCKFRFIRDYLLRLPLLIASALVRETGLTKRRNVAEQIATMMGKRDSLNGGSVEVAGWYARLFHFIENPVYNSSILEEFASKAGIAQQQALAGIYRHFNSSILHRLAYFLTPRTHGAHYRNFLHEMNEWRITRWQKYFVESGFEVIDVVPYRFHHLLELTWNTRLNTTLYHQAAPLIARWAKRLPYSMCSEFILVARKNTITS